MKKIPSVFQRDGDRLVRDEVVPGCEWVLNGEGVATVKLDGTACMVRAGVLFRRMDRKHGKPAPEGWEPCEDAPNEKTGHWPGWVPVGDGPADMWHREAWAIVETTGIADGTYELVGPRVQCNPYGLAFHVLWSHSGWTIDDSETPPRSFDGLRRWLEANHVEGIVWHHPDGRMAKIRRRDFGLVWP